MDKMSFPVHSIIWFHSEVPNDREPLHDIERPEDEIDIYSS